MPTVSVHIVTYNSAQYIRRCLESVFQQTHPISQVIVIDNASTDSTFEIVKTTGNNIRLVRNEANTGFAPAHNQAMALSDSDYYLVLNPDVVLHQDYVASIIKQMERDDKIGSATGKLLLQSDPTKVDSTGIVMNKARRAFDRGAGEDAERWNDSGEVFGVSGAAALYAKRMVDDIRVQGEFFDEDFFAYKEDVDVAWRARLLGWKAYYVADATAYHVRGWKQGARGKQPLFVRRHSYINRYKMMYKNDSLSQIGRNVLHIIPYEIAGFAFALFTEPGLLGAWRSFFKERPKLKQKRTHIKQRQKARIKF